MSERTTFLIGKEPHSGLPCSTCGTPYDSCSAKMLKKHGKACCPACSQHDTHDEQKGAVFAPDIVAFLEARLSEAEVLAREALGVHPDARWVQEDGWGSRGPGPAIGVEWGEHEGATLIYDEGGHDENVAEHIVFWQPDRALALVKSYRRIIDRYKAINPLRFSHHSNQIAMRVALGEVLIDLASLWREHPDWHPDWEVE